MAENPFEFPLRTEALTFSLTDETLGRLNATLQDMGVDPVAAATCVQEVEAAVKAKAEAGQIFSIIGKVVGGVVGLAKFGV